MKYQSRNPILAAVLSLIIPGLGQLYAGRLARALAIVTIGFFLILLVGVLLRSGDLVRMLTLEIVAGSLFSMAVCVDAWFAAKKADPDYQPDERNRFATYSWFVALVLAGSVVVAMYEAKTIQEHARTYKMAGNSMNPTLTAGDVVYVNHEPYLQSDPKPGEVVIYRSPKNRSQHWTSRVVALGGQTVEIKERRLLIDGSAVKTGDREAGLQAETLGQFSYPVKGMTEVADFGPVEVPKYQVFLLCDNRDNSVDSRVFGPVNIGTLNGRVKFRYWPRAKAGPVNEENSEANEKPKRE